jgi:FHA domain
MIIFFILSGPIASPLPQVPTGTNQFFDWFFYGLQGLGGWLLFLLLALGATIWLLYDSQKRHLPATGWRLGVILLSLLLLPTILYRFTVTDLHFRIYQVLQLYEENCPIDVITQNFPEVNFTDCNELRRSLPPLTPFGEYVFYLGLLGGVLSPVLAVGYYITFQGMSGCQRGHVYETALEKVPGQCPQCAAEDAARQRPPEVIRVSTPQPVLSAAGPFTQAPPIPQKPSRPALQYAWLVDMTNNRRYDLHENTTRIGRSGECDIMLTDQAVSRLHAQIRESSGHFTLSDLDSSSGTLLNGKKLRSPLVLQNGDEITVGDTVLRFVSSN